MFQPYKHNIYVYAIQKKYIYNEYSTYFETFLKKLHKIKIIAAYEHQEK